jgi:hypothetical protein
MRCCMWSKPIWQHCRAALRSRELSIMRWPTRRIFRAGGGTAANDAGKEVRFSRADSVVSVD